MSTYAEQPFTEFEERYFLAEILKKSALPPAHLLNIIREAGVEPAWTEIALPNGRSVSACQQAYTSLYSRTAYQPHPPQQMTDPSRRLKRPFSSMGDAATPLPRELQPRPPTFTSVNGQQVAIPPPTVMSPVEPQRKKRGRPTKSEFERRQQEARERGEIWPKPRKPKARPSAEGSEGSSSAAGTQRPASGGSVGPVEGVSVPPSGPLPALNTTGIGSSALGYSAEPSGPSSQLAAVSQPQAQAHLEQRYTGSASAQSSVTPSSQKQEVQSESSQQRGLEGLGGQEAQHAPAQTESSGGAFVSRQTKPSRDYQLEQVRQSQQP